LAPKITVAAVVSLLALLLTVRADRASVARSMVGEWTEVEVKLPASGHRRAA
jgi:hypothetical protein